MESMPKRGLAALVLLVMALAGRAAAAPSSDLTVLYVGAWNCAPCHALEKQALPDFVAKWRGAAAIKELHFRDLRDLTDGTIWGDYVFVRNRFHIREGTPRFFLVRGGRVVIAWFNDKGVEVMDRALEAATAPKLPVPPMLSDEAREQFLDFEDVPVPKAFARAPSGKVYWQFLLEGPTREAEERALDACEGSEGVRCTVLAVVGRPPPD
jgi:hypothetical protein